MEPTKERMRRLEEIFFGTGNTLPRCSCTDSKILVVALDERGRPDAEEFWFGKHDSKQQADKAIDMAEAGKTARIYRYKLDSYLDVAPSRTAKTEKVDTCVNRAPEGEEKRAPGS